MVVMSSLKAHGTTNLHCLLLLFGASGINSGLRDLHLNAEGILQPSAPLLHFLTLLRVFEYGCSASDVKPFLELVTIPLPSPAICAALWLLHVVW